jgi:2-polyprenyl-3-methyl-5-hydroxy-6-metoxy-1,4-benzoquinol methylase
MREKLEKVRTLIDEILASLDAAPPQNPKTGLNEEEFGVLKGLLESDQWPEAVFSAQIADENSEQDKEERAQGIADIILPPMEGKSFLDFGCGEGHVAKYLSKEARVSVGYDIEKSQRSKLPWNHKDGNFLLTSDFEKVVAEGPFDVILLYDVVDHVKDMTPSEMLLKAASVLAPEGRIFMRCHPWCGRHGGHLYRSTNKAFVHLVFKSDELEALGIRPESNLGVVKPLKTYGDIIKDAELINDSEPEIDNQEVEDFFRDTPVVRDRILKAWGVDKWEHDPPSFQMSQCFVDYVLKKK